MKKKRKVLLITGLSGAGLSTTLKSLEDLGWKAVDNLPLSLIKPLLAHKKGKTKPVAIGIDCRTWDFSAAHLLKELSLLKKKKDLDVSLAFIDCQNHILQQRFTETRRLHPMAADRPVMDGIIAERRRLQVVRKAAKHVIDTTDFKLHDLRRHIVGVFSLKKNHGLLVFVQSFGFKYGLPRDADMVFDVRFLDNPHWDKNLRPLTGLQVDVSDKVKSDKDYAPFFQNLTSLLSTLLPRYKAEGKNYLTIAIGCTGGRHRSVTVAENLYAWLEKSEYHAAVYHREIGGEKISRKKRG